MADGTWRERLRAAIKAKGMSMRSVSLAADMGPGYVFGLLSEGKEPTIDNLVKLCQVIDVPLYQIVYGDEAPAKAQEVVELWMGAGEKTRRAILDILRDRTPL